MFSTQAYRSGDLGVAPTWERVISPDNGSMVVSDEIGECMDIEISPDLRFTISFLAFHCLQKLFIYIH